MHPYTWESLVIDEEDQEIFDVLHADFDCSAGKQIELENELQFVCQTL